MAVEAQGGTLAIDPNQPQGSIFTVEIWANGSFTTWMTMGTIFPDNGET
jgi:hypothetical protein